MEDHDVQEDEVSEVSTGSSLLNHPMCAVASRAAGEDPIGTATPRHAFLAIEVPLPWPYDAHAARDYPPGLFDALGALADQPRRTGFASIAPDAAYSVPDRTRALYYHRPAPPFATYDREEYLIPTEDVTEVIAAITEAAAAAAEGSVRDALADVPIATRYRQDVPSMRDLLVCTHGTHDGCCATFGFPAYRTLRRLADESNGRLRVWRSSHLGDHRLAPTMIDLPDGRCWARLQPELLEFLATRTGPTAALRACYRGWSGLGGAFEQVAEREAMVREGWEWVDYFKTAAVLRTSEDGRRADVRIAFTDQVRGVSGAYLATVEIAGRVATRGSCRNDELTEINQYRIVRWARTSALDAEVGAVAEEWEHVLVSP